MKISIKSFFLTSLITAGLTTSLFAADPVVIGVSGPLTGPSAQYGQAWQKGFNLALDDINASGGIKGKPLAIDFQDTQNDPKQTITVAQKFISNPKILLATGDFSSTSSMAASPLYQRAGLIQFGFNNSNPAFTKTGEFIWTNSPSQLNEAPAHAAYARDLGLKKVAVFSLNTDWGKTTGDITVESLKKYGIQVVLHEAYLENEKDFKPLITKAKAAGVDGFVIVSYVNDASLIVQQIRGQGLTQPIVANGSQATADFPRLAGAASEGVYIAGDFSADDPRPEVVNFAKKWKAKYPGQEIDYFATHAYDSLILAAEILKESSLTRASVKEAFSKVKNVPSVIYGKVSFNPATRRVDDFLGARLVVKNGKFIVWDQKPAK